MARQKSKRAGWFLGPLDLGVQRRAALICAVIAVGAWCLARLVMQFPPSWAGLLSPVAWLLPFWSGGLSVMFIVTTLTLERPQHARWHQGVGALLVAIGCLIAYRPTAGIDVNTWPDLFLGDHRLRIFAASAFVFSMLGGFLVRPLFGARSLIIAALLVFTVIWFDKGAALFVSGQSPAPPGPFLFMAYGLLAAWAPLLAWISVRKGKVI